MDRYAVFGNPINHSKSPFIHTLFARQTQQQLSYEKIEAPVDEFVGTIRRFFPKVEKAPTSRCHFKEQAFQLVDQLSPRAKLAGAGEYLKLTDDGVLLGDNTDGAGLIQDLKYHLEELSGKKFCYWGWWCVPWCTWSLLEQQPAEIVIANQNRK